MGSMGDAMKTTLDIHDELLVRAKRHAKDEGRPLRAFVEDALRQALATAPEQEHYRLPDMSVGDPNGPNPLEHLSWMELRDLIYEGR